MYGCLAEERKHQGSLQAMRAGQGAPRKVGGKGVDRLAQMEDERQNGDEVREAVDVR
jgi:hypothetical protein